MTNTTIAINTDLHEVARYINFHTHPHASNYNSIEAIIAHDSENLKSEITAIMNILRTDTAWFNYSRDDDPLQFLQVLASELSTAKTIFIASNTSKFHPVVYDQLISIRQSNRINVAEPVSIHPDAKLFIVFDTVGVSNIAEVYEVTDHVLNLAQKEQ